MPLSAAPMLKQRCLTGAVLVLAVVAAVFYCSPAWFGALTGGVFVLAAWEWTHLTGLKTRFGRILTVLGIPSLALCVLACLPQHGRSIVEGSCIAASILLFWVLVGLAVYQYPKGTKLYDLPGIPVLMGAWVFVPCWGALFALQSVSPKWALYPLVLVWAADTAAYFAGKKWGAHRLAPLVSPGKTWEGVAGALVSTVLISGVGFYGSLEAQPNFFLWVLLNVVTVLFSIVGDLFESLLKRRQNLKDSGSLLPGHGGILDRIDSLTAALPIFMIGFMFLDRIDKFMIAN